jgi:hypothetical protein
VADHEDSLAVALPSQVFEEAGRPLDRLPPALAARVRLLDVRGPAGERLRRPVQLAVIALAETFVRDDPQRRAGERDLGRLDRATEV